MEQTAPTIGDNRPPETPPIRDRLAEDYDTLTKRRDELLAAADRAPAVIEDEDTAGKVTDFVKQLAAAHKAAETHRVGEKEFFLDGGRQVDGFFKTITEPLAKAKKAVEARLTTYQRAKAAEERRRRVEEEYTARVEADRLARETARREQEVRDAETLEDAIAAEDAAVIAKAAAEQAHKAAQAPAADLSRSRGDYGGVASLRTFWSFRDLDRAELELEPLRQHLPQDSLDKAVRSFVKAGGRKLRGVEIFEDSATVVR